MTLVDKCEERVSLRNQVIKVRVDAVEMNLIDIKRRTLSRSEFLRNNALNCRVRSKRPNVLLRYQLASLHLLNLIYIQIQNSGLNNQELLIALSRLSRVEAIILKDNDS